MPTDNILFVQEVVYLYIKDYTGKNIIEDKIKVLSDYNEKACCGSTYGTYVFLDNDNNNIIHITIDNGKAWEEDFVQYSYVYNIKNKILTKKDSAK